jgi:hypothetical protein
MEAHIQSMVVDGSRWYCAEWVVSLVRVLLQAFFACLFCLSFELDAMLSVTKNDTQRCKAPVPYGQRDVHECVVAAMGHY